MTGMRIPLDRRAVLGRDSIVFGDDCARIELVGSLEVSA